jgi:uridylate kinase
MSESVVISVGGSLIVPDDIDTEFLTQFRDLVYAFVDEGKRFFIIAGGGKTARRYQAGLKEVRETDVTDLDWIGIHATRLNAQLLKNIFADTVYEEMILDPRQAVHSQHSVTVGAGWEPGCSTDYDAVVMAETVGAGKVVNLSNIDYVYDRDPKQYDDAQKITETDWPSFRALLPDEWNPGLNAPFDPVAAKEAEANNIEVALLNGDDPDNIRQYLHREEYIGTVVRPA